MHRLRMIWSGLLTSALGAITAQAAVLIPIVPVTGASQTTAFAINDNNIIAGSFVGSSDGVEHSFFGTLAGAYTTFDVGTGGSEARGIDNAGDIAGFSNSQTGVTANEPAFERLPKGKILNVTMQGRQLYGQPQNLDSKGRFAGTRWDFTNLEAVAFIGRRGKWLRDVTIPAEHQASTAGGIDSSGTAVGMYFRPPPHGFIVKGRNLTTVDYPSSDNQGTVMEAINDNGQAVGQWLDSQGKFHSFVYDVASASFTDIKVKGASRVQAWSINAAGAVALGSDAGSFIWCPTRKNCPGKGLEVDAPVHARSSRPPASQPH